MSLGFAARVPALVLRDPLAELLGARDPGEPFRYTWEDAVKLAGHSCPTVAGAWLVTATALRALYRDAVPVRGDIEVTIGARPDQGGFGPMAQVIAQITGAAPATGFAGLLGHFRRRDLLTFDPTLGGRFRFRRLDTGEAVELTYDPSPVPAAADLPALLARALAGKASPEERRQLGELWQARVEALLTGDPALVVHVA